MSKFSNRIFRPGNQFLIAFLTFLSCFPPLTIDMYLPALPTLAQSLGTTDEMASYTLSSFFLFYAFATLVWGPISDKYGRKPVLLFGSILYILASLLIFFCGSIQTLLALRWLQAIGCATASSMSLAIVRDIIRGPRMETIISYMQSAHILAPLTAPVLGGALLYFMSWRGIFIVLTLCGCISLAGICCLKETTRPQKDLSLINTFGKIKSVAFDRVFRQRLFLFSFMAMPFSSFLSASSFVYQSQFQFSPQVFSCFFAFNAAFALFGPLAHIYFFSKLPRNRAVEMEMTGICFAGALIIFFGSLSPWLFAAFMAPVTFFGSALRPPGTIIMMECIRGNNGIVASLIQCGGMLFGSLSMFLATLSFWPLPTLAIGSIAAGTALIGLIFWIFKVR